jgi:glycosyltransferase involved in cell wall biosynthesis
MRIRARFDKDRPRARSEASHLLVIVENVPFSVDTRLRKQVGSLLERGYRVSVITRRDEGNRAYRSVPGLRLLEYPAPREGKGPLGYVREYGVSLWAAFVLSLRVCLREKVDVVQFCQPPDVYFPLAWLLRAFGSKILVDQRDLMPEVYAARFGRAGPLTRRLFRRLAHWNYRAAHGVLCVNDYLETYALEAGASPSAVTIVRNGPVLSRIDGATPDPALRHAERFLCCWIGKMGRQDRLDLLLAVADRLVHGLGRTDWHLAILGDGECLEETKATAARLGLEPWITFTGWVPEEMVFRYLVTSDLGLDASLQGEVSPVKAMEYMGASLPFAAFDLPETRAIADGAAVLTPPGDVDGLASSVSALLDDAGLREMMGRCGRKRVADALAWEHQGGIYLDAVDRLAEKVSSGNRTSGRIPA